MNIRYRESPNIPVIEETVKIIPLPAPRLVVGNPKGDSRIKFAEDIIPPCLAPRLPSPIFLLIKSQSKDETAWEEKEAKIEFSKLILNKIKIKNMKNRASRKYERFLKRDKALSKINDKEIIIIEVKDEIEIMLKRSIKIPKKGKGPFNKKDRTAGAR